MVFLFKFDWVMNILRPEVSGDLLGYYQLNQRSVNDGHYRR